MSRILVIEDQKLLAQLYRSALATAKHKVVLAYTGEDGVAEALREKPDLVILDLSLPGISGAEVADALHKLGFLPRTPLIIATTPSDDAYLIADLYTAAALLPKPFKISTLLSEVEAALSISAWKKSVSTASNLAAGPSKATQYSRQVFRQIGSKV
ncbi:MAG TPA: response regulator [Dehalococcoidia bacterium]|nr:response regulator [Dehalococcoidia bacterium]